MKKVVSVNANTSTILLENPRPAVVPGALLVQEVGCCGEFSLDCPYCWSSDAGSPVQDIQYANLY